MQVHLGAPATCTARDVALLRAVAYADVFDYPLTEAQLWRYLVGVAATPAELCATLQAEHLNDLVHVCNGFVVLAGRANLVEQRQERAVRALLLWKQARFYAARLAQLPFVRMVAVTGALAMDNVAAGADIDYLIVTTPNRLWLCQRLTVLLVRVARLAGHVICPNYLISERALVMQDRSLYTAHELAQMVPLAGMPIYRRMRTLNGWVDQWLPNAILPPQRSTNSASSGRIGALVEALLPAGLGTWLEQSEMERTTRRLIGRHGPAAEASFGPDWCKGHFAGHGGRILAAYQQRLVQLGIE
ncbi:MAG: hypothetical protein SH847_20955 [Roseiflexaceae bacterium]|nr:hypothetical protein [Roseiflexaceae bacterium]